MGPGEQSEIITGSTSVTKWKYESEFSQRNPGRKSLCVELKTLLFVYFVLDGLQEQGFLVWSL